MTTNFARSSARPAAPDFYGSTPGGIYELVSCHFAIDVEGIWVAVFTGCSGLSGEIEVETYHEGGLNDYEHKLPGRATYGNVTLSGGVGNSIDLWDWFHRAAAGRVRRRDVSIVMYAQNHVEALRWNLAGAYPVAWSGPDFDAGGEEATVHRLELAHNGISLSPPPLAVKTLLMSLGN